MEIEFEPTNSYCYRFARYVALPEILKEPEVVSGDKFHLLTVALRVINRHLTPQQLSETFIRKVSQAQATIGNTLKFYIPFLAKNLGELVRQGAGIYSLPSTTDEIGEQVLDEAELDSEISAEEESLTAGTSGTIYAYSFPLIMKDGVPFPIKIGMATGDVAARVKFQVQKTASFESAQILGKWPAQRVGAMESAIHNTLKARGRWRADAPGTEWFDTTVAEIEAIVKFVG